MQLVSLQFKTTIDFQKNLDKLVDLIEHCPTNSFIVAPEVCLTEFAYDRFEEAANFSKHAINVLLGLSNSKYISLTLIVKDNNQFYNVAYIFYKNQIIYKQSKAKLFPLGEELKYFTAGSTNDIQIVDIDGLKIGILICFEIRFIKLWEQLQGADLILVPSLWGEPRKSQYEILTRALAVANQCYVIASNSANDDMASSSSVINPFGEYIIDDTKEVLTTKFDYAVVKRMRRYMNIGLLDN